MRGCPTAHQSMMSVHVTEGSGSLLGALMALLVRGASGSENLCAQCRYQYYQYCIDMCIHPTSA